MANYREYRDRSLRGVDSIVTSVILKRSNPDYNLISFLIVEGEKDSRLYEEFINTNKCRIIIADGKKRVIEVLSILEKEDFPGVLAIVDADFDILEGKLFNSLNLLQTDTHDIELMIIASPALEKVLRQYGSKDKLQSFTTKLGKDIRSILVESAMPIGYLRWISLRENLSLKFEDLNFERFIDKQELTTDIKRLIRIVQSHTSDTIDSQKYQFKDDELHTRIQQLSNDSHDPWHVCCGHDVVNILSVGLCRAIGSNSGQIAKPDQIEKWLQLAYEQSYFSQTRLYAAIQKWEKANEKFMVLRVNSDLKENKHN